MNGGLTSAFLKDRAPLASKGAVVAGHASMPVPVSRVTQAHNEVA